MMFKNLYFRELVKHNCIITRPKDGRPLSRMKVSHFPESKTTYFLEVEDYEELRGQSFSIVGHKHGTLSRDIFVKN